MKRLILGAFLVLVGPTAVHGEVHVDIGIHLPLAPAFVVIPGQPVYYAPHASANVFLYANQYWAFADGGWYVGASWNGPWVVVAPAYVPAPILRVPVRYYPAPPPHWKGWRRDAAPHWESHHGRDWHEDAHERGWREREEHWQGRGASHGCKHGRC